MPYRLSISHEMRRVTVIVEGEGGVIEGLKVMAQIFAAGAIPYAKLIDFTFARPEEGTRIRQISQYVLKFTKGKKPGPLAIVATTELLREMVEMFEQQVRADRPMKIFADQASALAWLDEIVASGGTRLAS